MFLSGKSCGAIAALLGVVLMTSTPGHAQVATSIEQAELAGLAPATLAQVKARMAEGGQTVYEILQTMLLNNIKSLVPGGSIVALDFNRGIAIVRTSTSGIRLVNFDTTTLAIKS
jgi:predicted acylesterase/phospholipase RssA